TYGSLQHRSLVVVDADAFESPARWRVVMRPNGRRRSARMTEENQLHLHPVDRPDQLDGRPKRIVAGRQMQPGEWRERRIPADEHPNAKKRRRIRGRIHHLHALSALPSSPTLHADNVDLE